MRHFNKVFWSLSEIAVLHENGVLGKIGNAPVEIGQLIEKPLKRPSEGPPGLPTVFGL
jgi:hypothetical protein